MKDITYIGTRNRNYRLKASEAILKGICPDGGLFIPEEMPVMERSIDELSKMNYRDLAYEVMSLFFTDFTEDSLKEFILQIPQLQIKEIWTTGDVREGRGDERWLNILICKGKTS